MGAESSKPQGGGLDKIRSHRIEFDQLSVPASVAPSVMDLEEFFPAGERPQASSPSKLQTHTEELAAAVTAATQVASTSEEPSSPSTTQSSPKKDASAPSTPALQPQTTTSPAPAVAEAKAVVAPAAVEPVAVAAPAAVEPVAVAAPKVDEPVAVPAPAAAEPVALAAAAAAAATVTTAKAEEVIKATQAELKVEKDAQSDASAQGDIVKAKVTAPSSPEIKANSTPDVVAKKDAPKPAAAKKPMLAKLFSCFSA